MTTDFLAGEMPYVLTAEDLEAMTCEVWSAYLPDQFEPLYPVPALDEQALGVHASVGVHGAWNGQVVVQLSHPAAESVARQMLMLDPDTEVTPEDSADAVGELANVVGGNVKSVMAAPSQLGLPMVFAGTAASAGAHGASELCTVKLEWGGQPVRVTVWESDGQHQSNEESETSS